MIEVFDVAVPSLTGKEKRKAYVYLPVGYGEGETRYPVMYMFDGHNLFFDEDATFGKSWGLADYLDEEKIPIIIAAAECNHNGNARLSEYSPFDFTFKGEKIKGRGKKYMDWLVKDFKPYIDENYKTLSAREHTAIGGSSMGGLMTVYALLKYGKYFSRGAALSPSLWLNGGDSVKKLLTESRLRKNTYIYMDYGSREFANHFSQQAAFGGAVSALIEKGAIATARVVDGGTHSEASWQRQIPYFMDALFGFNIRT